jgi:hypothetical protein
VICNAEEASAYTATRFFRAPARRNHLSVVAVIISAVICSFATLIIIATAIIGTPCSTAETRTIAGAWRTCTGRTRTEPTEAAIERAGITLGGLAWTTAAPEAAAAATREIQRVRITYGCAGISRVSSCATPARQAALRALRTGQRLTTALFEALSGGVASAALLAALARIRSAGLTLRHTLQTGLELLAYRRQLLGELATVLTDLLAHVTDALGQTGQPKAARRYTGVCVRGASREVFAALGQLLTPLHDIRVVLAQLPDGFCGAAQLCGLGGRALRAGTGVTATNDQK